MGQKGLHIYSAAPLISSGKAAGCSADSPAARTPTRANGTKGGEESAFASGIKTVHCDQQLRQHCLSEPSRGQPSSSFLSALMSEAPQSPFSRIIFIICTTITSPAQPTVSTTHPCSSGDEKCSRRARLAPLARQIQLITACLGLTSARRRSGGGGVREDAGTRARRTDGRTDRETGQGSSKRLMLMEGRSEWGLSADVVDDHSD